MAKPALKKGKCLHSIGEDLSGRFDILTILQGLAPSAPLKTAILCMLAIHYWLVPHSFHPTLYVLFLITFTEPLPERLGLNRKFKRGVKIRVKDTG